MLFSHDPVRGENKNGPKPKRRRTTTTTNKQEWKTKARYFAYMWGCPSNPHQHLSLQSSSSLKPLTFRGPLPGTGFNGFNEGGGPKLVELGEVEGLCTVVGETKKELDFFFRPPPKSFFSPQEFFSFFPLLFSLFFSFFPFYFLFFLFFPFYFLFIFSFFPFFSFFLKTFWWVGLFKYIYEHTYH
jgi:hypothetical protein